MSEKIKLYLPTNVVYFFSVLYHERLGSLGEVFTILQNRFSNLIFSKDIFIPTNNPLLNYYSKQMGGDESGLKRFFCFSNDSLGRDLLVDIKLESMKIEKDVSNDFRLLNIDPGYVAKEQLVLSTHKPFAHRLYLNSGIYGEIEYIYKDNFWGSLPWTYPDYDDVEKKNYFLSIRKEIL